MNLEQTIDYKEVKTIITNPLLWKLTYGQDGKLAHLFVVDSTYDYILIKNYNKTIGVFQIKNLTNVTLEVHIFILPEFWGDNTSLEAVKLGHEWAKNHGYLSTFTMVPANCMHMHKFMSRINYKICGQITKAIIYNNYLVSLIFYEFDLGA